jgi:hypothetical protein
MAQQSRGQKATIGRVMHEFKHGELERGRGGKVKNPKQAIAIALSEAGASKYQSPAEKRRRLAHTKSKERRGETAEQQKEGRRATARTMEKSSRGTRATRSTRSSNGRRRTGGATRAELLQKAARRGIPGRSRMRKAELERALRK